jgi:hypothetical protein
LSLDAIQAQFQLTRTAPPVVWQLLDLVSPFQISAYVGSAGYGTGNIPVTVLARIYLTGIGRGLPQIPMSLSVNDRTAVSNVFTDTDGKVSFSATLAGPGVYSLKTYAGLVDPNNPAVKETVLTLAQVQVNSNLGVNVTGPDGTQFPTPVALLFPFYAGGPGTFSLSFPPIVNQGPNNAYLLLAPSQYTVTGNDTVNLPYVKPTLAIGLPASVLVGSTIPVAASITTEAGTPLPYQTVILEYASGTQILSLTSDVNGRVSTTLSLGEGVYRMQASWMDLNLSPPGQVEVILPVLTVQAPLNAQPNQAFGFSVTSRTKDGRTVTNLPCSLTVDGQFVKNLTTDASGNYSDTLSLGEGAHTIAVSWKNLAVSSWTIIVKAIQAAVPPPTKPALPAFVVVPKSNTAAVAAIQPGPSAGSGFVDAATNIIMIPLFKRYTPTGD